MKSFQITLTQESPVCFSNSRHKQNIFYTHDYIPGSVLWGFFINRYVKSKNCIHNDFFNDNVRFLNCFIKIETNNHKRQSLPVPLSLFTCKINPYTYLVKEHRNEGHALLDLLFTDELQCQRTGCLSELRPVQPGYFYSNGKGDIYRPRKIVEMHNRITKSNQNTMEDGLFSYELLDERGHEFAGHILVDKNSSLIEFIKKFNDKEIGLGKARTSGCGYFTFNISDETNPGIDKFFENQFHDEINLYLHSDVIVMDSLNRYQTIISPVILGLENELHLEKSFTSSVEIQGFNAKHQKTRINDTAVRKGSCFLYKLKTGADRSVIVKRMKEIEAQGLGIRKNEGFGRVKFNRKEFKED